MTFYEEQLKKIKLSCYANEKQIEGIIGTKKYIDVNYDKALNLDSLSSVRFTSKYHLIRLFKRFYGQTPRQYLIDVRIAKAKALLQQGMSVTETCFAVGFESLGSFSKLFKSKTGKTPSAFIK